MTKLNKAVNYLVGGVGVASSVLSLWQGWTPLVYMSIGGCVVFAIMVVLHSSDRTELEGALGQAGKDLNASRDSGEQDTRAKDLGFELLHRAAEAAREASLDRGFGSARLPAALTRLLDNGRLREFLATRVPHGKGASITVKWRQRVKGKDVLVSVFRDTLQTGSRKIGEVEGLENHYFQDCFEKNLQDVNNMRCLVVHDTEAPTVQDQLAVRARKRGYRSCLAIPLNVPALGNLKAFGNVGFLSLDCREPNAFLGLFKAVNESYPMGNQGENHAPSNDMHLLYGLADSLATIIELVSKREHAHGQ